ncbi:MAG: hypothetical protein WD844_07185 [Thermoleophilaceae bacterium]
MDVTAMLPGNRSRAERAKRQARQTSGAVSRRARREASAHPRAAAAGAISVVGACAAAVALARRSRNGGPHVHTTPQEGHPAGTGTRSDRDIGGPTAPTPPNQGATGAAPGTPPGSGFEPHA